MNVLKSLFILFSCLYLSFTKAQTNRQVCVLDMSNYVDDNSPSRQQSPIKVLRLAGVPYEVSLSLTEAIQYPIIITGSRISENDFTLQEISILKNYVETGGILITSYLTEPELFDIAGISSSISSNQHFRMIWEKEALPVFDLIDDPMEDTISLGRFSKGYSFYSKYYEIDGGQNLAIYEDQQSALVFNDYGAGRVYTFGPDLRDLIFRPQANFDVNAQRIYSNGFEPSADAVMFVIKNIIRHHIPHSVYKHTSPYNSYSSIMLTHDIDSRTGIDTMAQFSNYEAEQMIKAHYNITTRYFNDNWMSDFYLNAENELEGLKTNEHTISSHSVGHFPDFADFPFNNQGITKETYNPYYANNVTQNASVYSELAVSKSILDNDLNVDVQSFRAGHLAFPDSLMHGLELLGYKFDSTHSANDVMTAFPYHPPSVRSFSSQESSVLEIPMTISDVFGDEFPINAETYPEKVEIWNSATAKYHANYAPVTLLIHPNRSYKLDAMIDYINALPEKSIIIAFEDFGNYWLKRDQLKFNTSIINGSTLEVQMENNHLDDKQSFIIDWDESLTEVIFKDMNDNALSFEYEMLSDNQRLYYRADGNHLSSQAIKTKKTDVIVYPNPSSGYFNLEFKNITQPQEIYIYDLNGRLVYQKNHKLSEKKITLNLTSLNSGIYLLKINTETSSLQKKLVIKSSF